jgi:hypothetical protein
MVPSPFHHAQWFGSHRLAWPRTEPSQGSDTGSNPVGTTTGNLLRTFVPVAFLKIFAVIGNVIAGQYRPPSQGIMPRGKRRTGCVVPTLSGRSARSHQHAAGKRRVPSRLVMQNDVEEGTVHP